MPLISRQQGPIAVYGATGYTGKLVAAELAAAKADLVISGRNPEKLEALAAELDDPGLVFDPACAVACMRLLSDPGSPLFDPAACDAEVQGRIARIRAGFSTRERGGTADARAADGEPLYV